MKKNTSLLFVVWSNFFIGITFYFFQFSLRTSISVLGPNIQQKFSISPEQLATIAASYYYAYILFGLFSGILIDKFGVRILFIFSALFCGFGAFAFGFAHAPWLLYVGRMLMGAGSAFSLIIALTIIKKGFPHRKVPILMGITGAIGILGGLSGEDLLTPLSTTVHWRYLIGAGGTICFLLALKVIISFELSPKPKTVKNPKTLSNKDLGHELVTILHNKSLIAAFLAAAALFVSVDVFASVWGIPFLMHTYHYSIATSEIINTMIFVGFCIGSILLSLAAKKYRVDYIIKLSCTACFIFATLFVFSPANVILQSTVAFALGIAAGGVSAVLILVSLLASGAVIATAFSITELSKHIVSAIMIQLFGYMVESVHISGIGRYTAPCIIVLAFILVSCLISLIFIKRVVHRDHALNDNLHTE